MWSRARQIVAQPRLQHDRIQAAAFWILLIRLWEGAACWMILTAVLVPPTVPRFIIHANFAAYCILNVILFVRQRHASLTPGWVWVDIAANLVPMFGGLYWTGGVHSPLLPIFVLKLLWYGLIFGADVGTQALVATLLVGAYLAAADLIGLDLPEPVALVSTFGQQWIRLGFALVIYTTLVASSLRFARVAQEHERHLAATVREKEGLYARAVDHERALQQLSRRMMQMSEETLQQVARDLHDDLGQSLTAVRMEVGLIERQLSAQNPQRDQLEAVRHQLGGLLQTVRDLSRLLRPPSSMTSASCRRCNPSSTASCSSPRSLFLWTPPARFGGCRTLSRSPSTASYRRRWPISRAIRTRSPERFDSCSAEILLGCRSRTTGRGSMSSNRSAPVTSASA